MHFALLRDEKCTWNHNIQPCPLGSWGICDPDSWGLHRGELRIPSWDFSTQARHDEEADTQVHAAFCQKAKGQRGQHGGARILFDSSKMGFGITRSCANTAGVNFAIANRVVLSEDTVYRAEVLAGKAHDCDADPYPRARQPPPTAALPVAA